MELGYVFISLHCILERFTGAEGRSLQAPDFALDSGCCVSTLAMSCHVTKSN